MKKYVVCKVLWNPSKKSVDGYIYLNHWNSDCVTVTANRSKAMLFDDEGSAYFALDGYTLALRNFRVELYNPEYHF